MWSAAISIDSPVIEGDARGADRLAGEWARSHRAENIKFRAEWEKLGRKAGPIRHQLLDEGRPDVVVAFPGGKGIADMMMRAGSAGVEVIEAASQTGGTL